MLHKPQRSYSFIKGRMAEAIIERMFVDLGIEIYPVGFEAKIPRLAQLKAVGKLQPKIIQPFEYGPDFIAIRHDKSQDSHEVFPIEVKYRTNGKIAVAEFKKYTDLGLYFILIDPTNIYCVQKGSIPKSGKELDFKSLSPLSEHEDFNFLPHERAFIKIYLHLLTATFDKIQSDKSLKIAVNKTIRSLAPKLKAHFEQSLN